MPTLIDNPSFTSNEIYQLQATDPVEGAATGASFGGIGLSNQPHQQLADRTAFLKQRQDTNLANIAALQSFAGLFKGLMAKNGYVQIPFADINRGQTVAYVQWGSYFPPGSLSRDGTYTITWPIAFPNACEWAVAALSNSSADKNAGVLTMETVSLGLASGVFMSDWDGYSGHNNDGFYWIAIGF